MKYYSAPLQCTHSICFSDNPISEYNEVVEQIKDNYNLSEVIDLSHKLYPLTQQLANKLFYNYTNEIFEKLYISRFVLPQQQFCEIQSFIFSYCKNKYGDPLVAHLDTFFHTIVKNQSQQSNIENYFSIIHNYYKAAKSSEQVVFSQEQIELVCLKEQDIFPVYHTDLKQLREFVDFARHTIAFNLFKNFLLSPGKFNSHHFFSVLPYVSLKNDNLPLLNELSLFVKLMQQEHFDILSKFTQTDKLCQFLEDIFFFNKPRPNAKPVFYYNNQSVYNEKVVHLFNYDILKTLNQKHINLNVFFNTQTCWHNFSSFVLSSIKNKLKNTDLIFDEDGYNHLLTHLKVQDYFYLNDIFPNKLISSKHNKI